MSQEKRMEQSQHAFVTSEREVEEEKGDGIH